MRETPKTPQESLLINNDSMILHCLREDFINTFSGMVMRLRTLISNTTNTKAKHDIIRDLEIFRFTRFEDYMATRWTEIYKSEATHPSLIALIRDINALIDKANEALEQNNYSLAITISDQIVVLTSQLPKELPTT